MHGGGGGETATRPGKRGALKKTKIEIIPMIDTMFFLLVFFILSSVGALKLQGINLDMPKAEQGGAPTTTGPTPLGIFISIKPNGQMYVGAKPAPDPDAIPRMIVEQAIKDKRLLSSDVAGLERELKKAIVTVNADPNATHELVIKAIDEARKLKRETPDPDPAHNQQVGSTLITQFAIANSVDSPIPTAAAGAKPAGS